MLLQLPSELILGIFSFLDPASFYQCLLVCKTLVSHVRGSKKLLKQQIASVPGSHGWSFNKFLRIASASELLTVFAQRSKSHLLHGTADATRFKLASPKYRLGALERCPCHHSHMFMAVVNSESGAIGIHHMGVDGNPSLRCVLAPQSLCLGRAEQLQFKVLKCAFASAPIYRDGCLDRLAVLYSYSLPESTTEPFVQQAQQQSKLVLKLVTWHLWAPICVELKDIQDVYIGDGRVPTALALAQDGTPLVAFHSPDRVLGWLEEAVWEAEQYGKRSRDPMAPSSIVARSGQDVGLLAPSEIQIVKNRALFSFPVAPTPQWEMTNFRIHNSLTRPFDSFETLAQAGGLRHESIGLFLAACHQCVNEYNILGERVCINEVLQLHFQAPGKFSGAYIVKGVQAAFECERYDPTIKCENIRNKVVAKLDGIDEAASRSCSLGLVLAISPGGRRIAVASWDRVKIWTLEPSAFFMQVENHTGFEKACFLDSGIKRLDRIARGLSRDRESSADLTDEETPLHEDSISLAEATNASDTSDSDSTDPTRLSTINEHDWLRDCGFNYYRCNGRIIMPLLPHGATHEWGGKTHHEIVRLKPVSLPRCGVVHSLKFLNEETLWGWTDQGPVCWRISYDMSGRRWEEELELTINGASSFSDVHC